VSSFREIAPAVQRLLQSSTFNQLRLNANAYSNRALIEVPAILEECAKRAAAAIQVETLV
jgi:hypothetical protein